MFIVLTTVILLIVNTTHKLPFWVDIYEIFAIVFFILEWIGRIWVSSNKIKFLFSPLSIIDLLAIFPKFRLLRLLKVFRYISDINYLFKVFKEKSFEFTLLFGFFAFLVLFSGTSIYLFEGQGINDKIENYYDALYWSVITITTVGYGDISPITSEGKFITMLLIITGIMLISLLTSIITATMTDKLAYIKENNILYKIGRLDSFILVCGYGKMATTTLQHLDIVHKKIVVIDNDIQKVTEALDDGYLAIKADATNEEIFDEIDISTKASNILIFTGSDALNLSVALTVSSIKPDIKLFSRAINTSAIDKLKIVGVDEVLSPSKLSAENIYNYLLDKKDETIILGNSGVAYELEKIFINKGEHITLIEDIDYHDNNEFKKYGIDDGGKNVLCLSSDFDVNLFITMSVKMLNSKNRVITAVYNKAQSKKISLAGGDSVINPYIIGAKYIQECFDE